MNGREQAKEFYNNKNYDKALVLYEKIWNSSNKDDNRMIHSSLFSILDDI